MRVHAICLALNEEHFITEMLNSIYEYCNGISVITQYDRDWYGTPVSPDSTIEKVLSFPDKEGKINLILRRYKDETVARNHEMMSLCLKPTIGVESHGVPIEQVSHYHTPPDYFWIVDADEIYDTASIGNIIEFLAKKKPRGMRVTAHQYLSTWNQRIPLSHVRHHHFGFVKAGVLFKMRRIVSWNEFRLQKLLRLVNLPDVSSKLWGFINCPVEVGMFHHGSYLGSRERLERKFSKHSHPAEVNTDGYIDALLRLPFDAITSAELPENIRSGNWPSDFWL